MAMLHTAVPYAATPWQQATSAVYDTCDENELRHPQGSAGHSCPEEHLLQGHILEEVVVGGHPC